MLKNKKGIELEITAWYIIAIAALILLILAAIILKAKGVNIIGYIKDLFRFRG